MKHPGMITLMTGGLLLTACGIAVGTEDTPPAEHTASQAETSASVAARSEFTDLHAFTANTLDGDTFTAADWADADVTAINIWSTTCGPCIREMPELAEYANSLPEHLRVITWCLDADYVSESTDISGFLAECGFTDVTLTSGDGDLERLYSQLLYTPTTVFVDAEGNMVAEPIIGAGSIAEKYDEQFSAALAALGIAGE